MVNQKPRIATINAVPASIGPARSALLRAVPDADVWTLLDDHLLQDAEEQGGLTPPLTDRMLALIEHARSQGADAVMLTCSLYGSVADSVSDASIPVISADGPAFDAVAAMSGRRVAVVSGQPAPLADSVARTAARIDEVGSDVTLLPVLAENAARRAAGDTAALVELIADAVAHDAAAADAVFLAQYSLSPAEDSLQDRLGIPVLSGPQLAARTVAEALHSPEAHA